MENAAPRDAAAGLWLKLFLTVLGVIAVGVPAVMVGAWIGWRSAEPLPTEAQAREIASEVLPGAQIAEVVRDPSLFSYEHEGDPDADPVAMLLIGDDDYRAGSAVVELASPLPPTAATEERLRAAGWEVLSADRDGLVGASNGLLLYVLPASSVDSRPGPRLEIVRAEPVLAPVLAAVGLLGGGALGTLLAWWGRRQMQAAAPMVRRLVGVGSVTGSVMVLPTAVVVLITLVGARLLASPGDAPYPVWDFYMLWGARAATHLGWAVLAATLLAAFFRPGASVGR
jgi:hypothetical protein